jgi:hypothetical protein
VNAHKISTVALLALAFFAAGYEYRRHTAPEFVNYGVVERRLREVFCEQAVRTDLMKQCDPSFPRYGANDN